MSSALMSSAHVLLSHDSYTLRPPKGIDELQGKRLPFGGYVAEDLQQLLYALVFLLRGGLVDYASLALARR